MLLRVLRRCDRATLEGCADRRRRVRRDLHAADGQFGKSLGHDFDALRYAAPLERKRNAPDGFIGATDGGLSGGQTRRRNSSDFSP